MADRVSTYSDDIVELEYGGNVYFENDRFYVNVSEYMRFLYENLGVERYSYDYNYDFKNRIVRIFNK